MNFYWLLTELGTIVGAALAFVAIAHILRQRRSPSTTAAWLMAIVLVPIIGVPLYIMFGGRKLRRAADAKTNLDLLKASPHDNVPHHRLERVLLSYGIPAATHNNRLHLCRLGVEGYQAVMSMINGAQKTIHLETYIFGNDAVAAAIRDALARRAREGVEVRLLIDGWGSFYTSRRFFKPLVDAGGKLAIFNPAIHIPFARRTNLRNHRKIAVADGEVAIAGSANITAKYIHPETVPGAWEDLTFVVEGPAAWQFEKIFRADWEYATGESLAIEHCPAFTYVQPDSAMLQVVPSGPDVHGDPLLDAILLAIYSAERRIWIVTPYFVPDDSLAQALIIACHRGVDVRITVPKRSNHFLADIARGSFLRDIENARGTVLLYGDTMIHAKVLLIDNDVAIAGSANLDMRSLFLNFEVMQFVYSSVEIEEFERWLMRLNEQCTTGMKKPNAVQELVEGVVRLVAPML